jgi:hypothetical protein
MACIRLNPPCLGTIYSSTNLPHILYTTGTCNPSLRYRLQCYYSFCNSRPGFHFSISNYWNIFIKWLMPSYSKDSTAGIATSYGLDCRGVRVRVSIGERFFFSPLPRNRFCRPLSFSPMCTGGSSHPLPPGGGGCKAAGAWSWLLISNSSRGQQ